MDQKEQQRVNEAAQQFTEALVQSYRVASERGVSAQEQNAQLTQEFFNRTISNLRAQAEGNRQLTEELADQQQRQAEAAQTLTKESVNAYREFVSSAFSFGQSGIQAEKKAAKGKKS